MISYLIVSGWTDSNSILSVLPKEILSYVFSLMKTREYLEAQCKALGFSNVPSKEYYCHQIFVLFAKMDRKEFVIYGLSESQEKCVKTICRRNDVGYNKVFRTPYERKGSKFVNIRIHK